MASLFAIKTIDEIIRVPRLGVTHFDITVHWFCQERPVTPGTFVEEELGWHNAGPLMSEYAYQFFTSAETAALRNYLVTDMGAQVLVEEVFLPLQGTDVPYSRVPAEPAAGENYGFVELPRTSRYPLDLSAKGFYDREYKTVEHRQQIAVVRALFERSGVRYDTTHL